MGSSVSGKAPRLGSTSMMLAVIPFREGTPLIWKTGTKPLLVVLLNGMMSQDICRAGLQSMCSSLLLTHWATASVSGCKISCWDGETCFLKELIPFLGWMWLNQECVCGGDLSIRHSWCLLLLIGREDVWAAWHLVTNMLHVVQGLSCLLQDILTMRWRAQSSLSGLCPCLFPPGPPALLVGPVLRILCPLLSPFARWVATSRIDDLGNSMLKFGCIRTLGSLRVPELQSPAASTSNSSINIG